MRDVGYRIEAYVHRMELVASTRRQQQIAYPDHYLPTILVCLHLQSHISYEKVAARVDLKCRNTNGNFNSKDVNITSSVISEPYRRSGTNSGRLRPQSLASRQWIAEDEILYVCKNALSDQTIRMV